MTRAANEYERADHERDLHRADWRPGDPIARAPLDAFTVTQLARAPSTDFDEAMHLIEGYAKVVAADAVIKALHEAHSRTMAILDAPTLRAGA